MDEIKDFEKLEGLSWENFFEQVDKLYVSSEDENDEKNEEAAFSGVATLPHDKAVCYGVCTVSQVPKLVRCEDCSLVVKLVGFGHHRKFRHRESRLLTRQSVKNPDDSSNSDSNDDCQGFLLSPPHHHLSSVASTSESCTFESQQWRLTHPSETCSTSNQSQRNATRVNKQPPKEAPRLYDVEKRNDLRLVLKRTPEKPSSHPQRNTDVNTRLHLNQNIQEQKTPEEVLFKKSSRKPSSKSIISKKKRKKKDSRRPKDLGQEANEEEEDSPEGVYQQSPTNDFQECDTFTDDADPDDDSFVTIPMQLTPSNDDSFVTIPTQLTPVTAASFWDPRESAGRPDAVKGTFKRAPLNNRLTANSVPIRKTMLNLSARQFQVCSNSIGTEINNKKDDNLDKIAGPSILKRPGQIMSPQQQQQHIQRTEEKTPVHQQVPNKYSSINTSNNYKKQISEELPQNQFLQNQFSKMQQQMQKRRVLTRDFDAISPRNIRKPLTEEVNNHDSQHSHSPSSDTSSSTSNIYMDTQDNLTTTDLLNNSKLPNVGTQTEEEFSNSNKFVQNIERFSKIHSEKGMINTQKPATMYRLFTRNSPNGGSNECKTMIVKSNVNTLWKGNDSNSSESSLTQQQRKISNASFSGRGHYITPSGTRFVPVDPRGLVSLQKNSASNSITSSKSNSPVAAPIPSTPSPASYTNSPSRCELINTNVDVRTSREIVQNSSFEDNYEHITTTPKTNTIPSRRQQQQQLPQQQQQKQHPFPPTQTMLNSFFRKRPFIDEIPQQSIMTPTRYQQQRIPSIQQQHNFKRFRPLVPQETDHQQYASCVDSFTSDARIHQSSRIRTIYPKKQQHSSSSNFSISPIPSSSSSTIGFSEQQQQQTSSYQYQTNQIINQRMHLTSQQKQQQNYSSPQNSQFRQQQQQSFTPRHHYYKQQNLMLRNNNLLNRGLSTSTNYFPKSLSSLSGEFALEHPHYTQQRFQYEKQQQQFINTEDTSFNEYIIGSPPPPSEQQQQIFSERMTSGGIYEQVENSSGINIMRRTDQLPPSFSYNTSTPIISSTPNRRLLPPPSYNSQQQNYSSSNRFSSSQQIAHNNNNTISSFLQSPSCVQLSMDYNNIQQQQQRFHQRTIKQPEYRPGIDSIDSHVIDPPPVLEAEGRLSSIEIIQPVYNNNTRQLGGVVCSNESVVNNLSTPNKINHSNEEDPGTRSSSASDLDLREIVHNPSSK